MVLNDLLPNARTAERGTEDSAKFVSMRRHIGSLTPHPSGYWRGFDSTGRSFATFPNTGRYEIQGRPETHPSHLASELAIVANMDSRIRALINRDALPGFLARAVDRYNTGRGKWEVKWGSKRPLPLTNPGFTYSDTFEGSDGKKRSYTTYNAHLDRLYLCSSTTGVKGGGIVRAIIPINLPAYKVDEMPEPDSNGNGSCRWIYVALPTVRLGGWIATKSN